MATAPRAYAGSDSGTRQYNLTRSLCIAALVVSALSTLTSGLLDSLHTPLENDEVITATVASQPGAHAIWHMLADHADSNPPLFYLTESVPLKWIKSPELALRVIPLLGATLMQVALFIFVRKYAGDIAGLVASLLPALTMLQTYYVDARPYGLVLGLTVVLMICWASNTRFAALGICVSVALIVSFHYYGVFACVCIALAEAIRTVLSRKIRWGVWIACGVGLVPLAFYWPLLKGLREYYGAHFWAHSSLNSVLESYGRLLSLPGGLGLAFAMTLVTISTLLVREEVHENSVSQAKSDGLILASSFIALPWIAFLVLKVSQGGFDQRYVLMVVLGVSIATGILVSEVGRFGQVMVLLTILLAFVFHEVRVFRSIPRQTAVQQFRQNLNSLTFPKKDLPSLPIVFSSHLQFLPAAYYAMHENTNDVVTLINPAAGIRYTNTDSTDINLRVLRKYRPMNAVEFGPFIQLNPRFLLLTNGDESDWIGRQLLDMHYIFQLELTQGSSSLYLVSTTNTATP